MTPLRALLGISFIAAFFIVIGVGYFFMKTNNENLVDDVEREQFIEQIRLLNEDLQQSRETVEIMRRDWRPIPERWAPKESTADNNVYLLKCYTSDVSNPNAKPLFDKVTPLTPNESVYQVCRNTQTDQYLFVTSKSVIGQGKITGQNTFYLYGSAAPTIEPGLTVLTRTDNSIYGACSEFLYWTKSGGIYYECSGGDGAVGGRSIHRIDLNNQFKVELAQTCSSYSDGVVAESTCSSSCNSSNDCDNNQFCDLGTNSCIERCSVGGMACGSRGNGGTCVGYGPVLGCKIN